MLCLAGVKHAGRRLAALILAAVDWCDGIRTATIALICVSISGFWYTLGRQLLSAVSTTTQLLSPVSAAQLESNKSQQKNSLTETFYCKTSTKMPHATEEILNGDTNSSKTVSHLTSYPAVSDSINTFKQHPYGKKSLEIVDNAYARFGKPVEPYLETPYSYAKPYVSKADELGDRALSTVDGHFPIVKEKTDTIYEKAKSTAFWPYTYLNDAWSDEYKKTAGHNGRGNGISTSVLAVISLELRVASDFFHYVADTLRPAYEETKQKAEELTSAAQDKYTELKGEAKGKIDEASKTVSKKTEEVKDTASKKAEDVKDTASKKTDDAKKEAEKAKDKVTK